MGNNHSIFPPDVGTLRFGSIAIARRYVNSEQVRSAISEQDADHMTRKTHRFLGMILLENHMITEEQQEEHPDPDREDALFTVGERVPGVIVDVILEHQKGGVPNPPC